VYVTTHEVKAGKDEDAPSRQGRGWEADESENELQHVRVAYWVPCSGYRTLVAKYQRERFRPQ
jgi:hypothetical protein